MNPKYQREMTILPSMCDGQGLLSVPHTFALFMDIATEHAEALDIGFRVLMPQGLFWLTARTKVRFHRRPGLTESVLAVTWPEAPERSRCNRDYAIRQNGETLIEGKTEWMIMNMKTGRLCPTDSVFPKDLKTLEDRVLPGPYMRLTDDFTGAEDFYSYTVRSTDVDVGGHMNNAAYVRAVAGAFDSKTWQAMDVRELEMWYRTPCYEGETLRFQRRQDPEGLVIRLARGEKTVALARIN